MASITVKIKPEELDDLFLKNIRALFKNGQVSVTFESDDTSALEQMANRRSVSYRCYGRIGRMV